MYLVLPDVCLFCIRLLKRINLEKFISDFKCVGKEFHNGSCIGIHSNLILKKLKGPIVMFPTSYISHLVL